MQRVKAILVLSGVLSLAACSGGSGDTAASPPAPPPPPSQTTILGGNGSSAALAVLPTKTATAAAAGDESNGYLLTRVIVLLQANATVDQFNAAARSVNAASILSSRPNFPILTLEVPRQADTAALISLARSLRSQPGVADAFAAKALAPAMLPATGPRQPAASLSHLLATRFPQAWNAHGAAGRDCSALQGRPMPVYVADRFGPSSLAILSFATEPPVQLGPTGDDPAGYHGMRVALAIAGAFDDTAPTGTSPFAHCVQIRLVDAELTDATSAAFVLVNALSAETGHFIVNMSLNFADPSSTAQTLDVAAVRDEIIERAVLAQTLIEALRLLADVSDERMLVTVSAGNVAESDVEGSGLLALRYRGFRDARFSNPFTLATLLSQIDGLVQDASLWTDSNTTTNAAFDAPALARLHADLQAAGTATLGLENVVVVDSGTVAESPEDVSPSDFDFLNADVRAVADPVKLTGVDNPSDLNQVQFAAAGTSLAAAQVAGLAAYLWSLSPELASKPTIETQRLILGTAHAHAGSGLLGVPLLDAYAATLALDGPDGALKIRRTLLDANDDGLFDRRDLALFAEAYDLANPNRATIPTARDFSRFDLNGDGYTGGIVFTAFDLDTDGFDTVEQTVEGYAIDFNEAALSDLQVLCYYAYSSLYFLDSAGQNDLERTRLLGTSQCIGAQLDVLFPAQLSAPATLSAVVEVPDGNGSFAPAPNVLVDLESTCAAVSPASGRTDANGGISATVTPSSGCTSVSVRVTARADSGTRPLAEEVVTAAVSGGPRCPRNDKELAYSLASATEATPPLVIDRTAPQLTNSLSDADSSASITVNYGTVDARAFFEGTLNPLQFAKSLGEFSDALVINPADTALIDTQGTATYTFRVLANSTVSGRRAAARWGVDSGFPDVFATSAIRSTIAGRTTGDLNGGTYSVTAPIRFGRQTGFNVELITSVSYECDFDNSCSTSPNAGGSGTITASLHWEGMTVRDQTGNSVSFTVCSASGVDWSVAR